MQEKLGISYLLLMLYVLLGAKPLFAQANPDEALAGPWQNKIETLIYWTPERLKEAEQIDDETGSRPPELPPITPGGDIGGLANSPRPYLQNFMTRITGELFLYDPIARQNNHCSASVIKSPSRRLLITAAHCVISPTPEPPLVWNQYLMFVPAYDGTRPVEDEQRAPYGFWPVSRVYVSALLGESPGQVILAPNDLAVVGVFDRLPGERIETVVGGGLTPHVNATSESFPLINVLGYPGAFPYDGTTQYWCLSTTQPGIDVRMPNCKVRFGHSGGPIVLVNLLNPPEGTTDVVAVVHSSGGTRVKPILFPNLDEMANRDHECNVIPCAACQ
jgi:V8-like Glu-specific endopeptidase